MSQRFPTEEDYEKLKKACENNLVAELKTLCAETCIDLDRTFGFNRVSARKPLSLHL